MKHCLIMIIVLFFKTNLPAQYANTKWGMSITEVKNNLKVDGIQQIDSTLFYQDNKLIRNFIVNFSFFFSGDKLNSVSISYDSLLKNSKEVKKLYNTLFNILSEKFGFPNTYIEIGNFTIWTKEDTNIILLTMDDKKLKSLYLSYSLK